jgi:Late exocytosis, associated with Golgi transport/Cytosolic domain of 10TM putative phosphate transporter
MRSYYNFYSDEAKISSSDFWSNFTKTYSYNNDDFTSQFNAAEDVSVDAVLTSIYLNSIAFVILMCTYECLRRLLPSVYSSQIKRQYKNYGGWTSSGGRNDTQDSAELNLGGNNGGDGDASSGEGEMLGNAPVDREASLAQLRSYSQSFMLPDYSTLPDVITSFNWVAGVFSVSWDTIRKYSGLDGYFFLRYIRMNLRICFVTAVWAFIILVPTYASGNNNNQKGWYHLSVANVLSGSPRMWIPAIFAYLFTGFIFFVMKQEYRHFLELRMDFLARGTSYIHPQHHYSLIVENIPHELRSEKALADYFESLFPGKVHSASMVLNLPDLELVAARCMRVCRRLEKSIAYYHDTGKRATHNVGSPRIRILGIDTAPCDFGCCATPNVAYVDNRDTTEKPEKGTHVDSISYYTYDLAETNKELHVMQTRKVEMAFVGSSHVDAENWITKLMVAAYEMADEIMIDSAEDNALRTNYSSVSEKGTSIPQAELMSTRTLYGTLGVGETARTAQCGPYASRILHSSDGQPPSAAGLLYDDDNGSMSSESHNSKALVSRLSEGFSSFSM